jgi:hypothetical protein
VRLLPHLPPASIACGINPRQSENPFTQTATAKILVIKCSLQNFQKDFHGHACASPHGP